MAAFVERHKIVALEVSVAPAFRGTVFEQPGGRVPPQTAPGSDEHADRSLRRARGQLHAFVFERFAGRVAGAAAALAFEHDRLGLPRYAVNERRRPGADYRWNMVGRRPVAVVPPDPLGALQVDIRRADRRLHPVDEEEPVIGVPPPS